MHKRRDAGKQIAIAFRAHNNSVVIEREESG
jgi:hypothetical protein